MELYITTGLIMLASLSGLVFLVKRFSDWLTVNSKFIIAFSAGIFAVVAFDLLIESFEFSTNWIWALGSVLAGFLVFQIAEKMFPELHHHHEGGDEHECSHSKGKVIWGDALHNIGDGILLAIAFSVDLKVGLVAALGIFVHEFVQEINEFAILKLSGLSTKRALIINFLVSATIIPGVLIGMYFANLESGIGILFGLAAGAFLHLIFVDLIPVSISNSKKDKKYFTYIFLTIAGVFTIFALNYVSGGHNHDTDHDEEHLEEVHEDEYHIEEEFHLE